MTIRRTLALALVAGTAATAGYFALGFNAGAANPGKPIIGTWGFDLAAMDRSVKPGDDFFRFAGGTWMKNTPIPPDRSRWGSFNILGAKSEQDVKKSRERCLKSPTTQRLSGTESRRLLFVLP